MATYSPTNGSTHQTLTGATVDTVNLPSDFQSVEVLNRDSTSTIYFTVDGTTPTVAGDGTLVVLPGAALSQAVSGAGNTVVKLISSGAAAYSVTGLN
jgi:hypothetical protein